MNNMEDIIINNLAEYDLNEVKCHHCGNILLIKKFYRNNRCSYIECSENCTFPILVEKLNYINIIMHMPIGIIRIVIDNAVSYEIYDNESKIVYKSRNRIFSNLSNKETTTNELETIITFQ